MDRAARWFLTARPAQLDVAAEVERFAAPVAELAPQLHTILQGTERALSLIHI